MPHRSVLRLRPVLTFDYCRRMSDLALDHLYRETHEWEASVEWWSALGFSFTETWGSAPHRAGRLACGRASVVLAEVPTDADAGDAVFLTTGHLEGLAASLDSDISDTHWGTRMISLVDPDGRRYHVEPGSST